MVTNYKLESQAEGYNTLPLVIQACI